MTPMRLIACALVAANSIGFAYAGVIAADVTVTDPNNGFSAPIFSFYNLSDAGYQISNVHVTGGFFDFVFGPLTSYPITAPAGGTFTPINGTQVSNTDVNDGCNAVDFNLTSFDTGDSFKFLADPENNACQSVVYDIRQRLAATSGVFAYIDFVGPDIAGTLELSGNGWIKELINPALADTASNELYRLSVHQTVNAAPNSVPEPLTVSLFGVGLAGLVGGAVTRRRRGKSQGSGSL